MRAHKLHVEQTAVERSHMTVAGVERVVLVLDRLSASHCTSHARAQKHTVRNQRTEIRVIDQSGCCMKWCPWISMSPAAPAVT